MLNHFISSKSPNYIRNRIRKLRQSLSLQEQNDAGERISRQLLEFEPIQQAKQIALYLPFDGEIDTQKIITELWKLNKNLLLPVIHPFHQHHLIFVNYSPKSILEYNRFKIPEPEFSLHDIVPLDYIDIILVPLVAFDEKGQRLGMGGGFYDRLLKDWQKKNFLPVGLAHNCQKVKNIFPQPWDIPLPIIFTPSKKWQR